MDNGSDLGESGLKVILGGIRKGLVAVNGFLSSLSEFGEVKLLSRSRTESTELGDGLKSLFIYVLFFKSHVFNEGLGFRLKRIDLFLDEVAEGDSLVVEFLTLGLQGIQSIVFGLVFFMLRGDFLEDFLIFFSQISIELGGFFREEF